MNVDAGAGVRKASHTALIRADDVPLHGRGVRPGVETDAGAVVAGDHVARPGGSAADRVD